MTNEEIIAKQERLIARQDKQIEILERENKTLESEVARLRESNDILRNSLISQKGYCLGWENIKIEIFNQEIQIEALMKISRLNRQQINDEILEFLSKMEQEGDIKKEISYYQKGLSTYLLNKYQYGKPAKKSKSELRIEKLKESYSQDF